MFLFEIGFRSLFDLSENKFLTVAQMFDLGWDAGWEAWVEKEIVGVGGRDDRGM